MKPADIELLLKDLSARLPYGVKFKFGTSSCILDGVSQSAINEDELEWFADSRELNTLIPIETVRPYLRPMSSMTEEEMEELKQEHLKDERLFAECLKKAVNGDNSMRGKVIPHFAADWCNKNHFDYHGLIDKGLAIEVTKENNPYQEK